MTAKQALIRAVDSGKPVFDKDGHKHFVKLEYDSYPFLYTANPRYMPFCKEVQPYRFEDMNDD